MPTSNGTGGTDGGNAGDVGGGMIWIKGITKFVEEKLAFNVTSKELAVQPRNAHICHCPITGHHFWSPIMVTNINIQRNGATKWVLKVPTADDGSYCVLNWGTNDDRWRVKNEADGSWTRRLLLVQGDQRLLGDRYEYEVITNPNALPKVVIATDEPTAAMLQVTRAIQDSRFMPALRLLTAVDTKDALINARQGLVQRIGDHWVAPWYSESDYEVDKVIQSHAAASMITPWDKPAIRGLGRHIRNEMLAITQTLSYTEAVKTPVGVEYDDTERLDDLVSAVNPIWEQENYKLQYGSPIMTKCWRFDGTRTNENRRTQGLLLVDIESGTGKVIIDNLKLELLVDVTAPSLEIEGLYDATGTAVRYSMNISMSLFTNGQFSGRVDWKGAEIPALAALAQNDYTNGRELVLQFRRTVFSLNAKSLIKLNVRDMQFATFQRPPEGALGSLLLSVRKPTEEAKDGAPHPGIVQEGYDETDEIAPGAAYPTNYLSFSERRLNLFQLSEFFVSEDIIENENVQLGRVPVLQDDAIRIVPYVMETGENATKDVVEDNRQPLHNALSNHKGITVRTKVTTVTRGILNALLTQSKFAETLFPTITVDTNDVDKDLDKNLGLTWTLNVRALETASLAADYGKTPLVATEYYTIAAESAKPEYASYMPIAISGEVASAMILAAAGHEDDFMTRDTAQQHYEAVNPGKTMSHAAQTVAVGESVRKNAAGFTNLREQGNALVAAAKAGSSANDVWPK
ncbi:phage major capsid protein [Salmonella phage SPFM14]|nr:phage major capsid protein [Salmonella phage SPFM14]